MLAGAFVFVTVLILLRDRGEGPIYKNRHLSEWVEARGHFFAPPADIYFDSEAAIQEAGTNAFPYLLKWIQHEDSKDRFRWLLPFRKVLPERLFFRLGMSRASVRAYGAAQAIGLLSSNVPPEVALELANLLDKAKPQTANRAALALRSLGPRGADYLLLVLQKPDHQSKFIAAAYLYQMSRLGELAIPPKRILPVLIEYSGDTNGATAANNFLSDMNVTPNQYVSTLANLLADSDVEVRTAATNALRKIAPEALTNAPANK